LNVIQIVSDTFRRDFLGCYGNDWIHTENLDDLAKQSTVFDRAYIASFPTIPNRHDLFTGRYTFPYSGWAPLPRDEVIISQTLRQVGYTTMLIVDTYHMIKDGFYFDSRFYPMKELDLEGIKGFDYPDFSDPARYKGLRSRAEAVRQKGYATVSGAGVGIMLMSSWLRGMEQFFIDMATDKKLASYLLDRVTESACTAWENSLPQIGDILDVASTGDDLANQAAPLVSMDMFEDMLKPRYKKIIDTIKKRTGAKVSFHSCGAVYQFIPHLIDIGVDILNPVQVSASGMDTGKLKKEFGADMVFWGGGCDTQKVLPFGSPRDVREEVKKRIEDLAPGGGFVFNQVHNIQAGVPPENIMAMYETLWEYGKY